MHGQNMERPTRGMDVSAWGMDIAWTAMDRFRTELRTQARPHAFCLRWSLQTLLPNCFVYAALALSKAPPHLGLGLARAGFVRVSLGQLGLGHSLIAVAVNVVSDHVLSRLLPVTD